ncbi:MAG: sulfotransferase domain-containing protein [Anaerolineales bacterium]|nr:sulfotransferase domain-containing protein [Anaerolineales bacterium]
MNRFFRKKSAQPSQIVIVSGLPRSGTSMMMKMLEAGGIPPLTDQIRSADIDNPKGYYEFERAKKLPEGDIAWLPDAQGKAVKVIAALLVHLPAGYEYRVLFMRRKMEEILASQNKMLAHRGEQSKVDDATMADLFAKHVAQVENWMRTQPNLQYLDVDYNAMLAQPEQHLAGIIEFLNRDLDAQAMLAIVDPNLYRQRK